MTTELPNHILVDPPILINPGQEFDLSDDNGTSTQILTEINEASTAVTEALTAQEHAQLEEEKWLRREAIRRGYANQYKRSMRKLLIGRHGLIHVSDPLRIPVLPVRHERHD